MNLIEFDYTLIVQIISFLFLLLLFLICVLIFVLIRKKWKKDKEISEKLDLIVGLLENNEKNSYSTN